MDHAIPKKSTDCRFCHVFDLRNLEIRHASGGECGYCERHPGGQDYTGPEMYVPSEWVQETVGKKFNYPFGDEGDKEYLCTGYDYRCGFWMKSTKTGKLKSVSERAIGRTFHAQRYVPVFGD